MSFNTVLTNCTGGEVLHKKFHGRHTVELLSILSAYCSCQHCYPDTQFLFHLTSPTPTPSPINQAFVLYSPSPFDFENVSLSSKL